MTGRTLGLKIMLKIDNILLHLFDHFFLFPVPAGWSGLQERELLTGPGAVWTTVSKRQVVIGLL